MEFNRLPAETVVLNLATLSFAMSRQFQRQMMTIFQNELKD